MPTKKAGKGTIGGGSKSGGGIAGKPKAKGGKIGGGSKQGGGIAGRPKSTTKQAKSEEEIGGGQRQGGGIGRKAPAYKSGKKR